MKTPTLLAKIDSQMNKSMNLFFYFKYIFLTFICIFRNDI